MSNRLDVPEIFEGAVPEEFINQVLDGFDFPKKTKLGRWMSRLFYKTERLDEQNEALRDIAVKSLYTAAIAQEGEAIARHEYEQDRYHEVTGLLNRKHTKAYGDALLGTVGQDRKSKVIFFLVDVVDFGEDINNVYGHPQGDIALRDDVADFLKSTVRADKGDLVGQWGGDEFVILVDSNDASLSAQQLARKIGGRLIEIPFIDPKQPKQIRFRMVIGEAGQTIEDLAAKADLKGLDEWGNDKKVLAVHSRINPSYFSGELSKQEMPSEAA